MSLAVVRAVGFLKERMGGLAHTGTCQFGVSGSHSLEGLRGSSTRADQLLAHWVGGWTGCW